MSKRGRRSARQVSKRSARQAIQRQAIPSDPNTRQAIPRQASPSTADRVLYEANGRGLDIGFLKGYKAV